MATRSNDGFESDISPLGAFLLDEGNGPALPIGQDDARALVARVIAAGRRQPQRRSMRARRIPIVIGLMAATTAAAAAYQGSWPLPWSSDHERAAPSARLEEANHHPRRRPRTHAEARSASRVPEKVGATESAAAVPVGAESHTAEKSPAIVGDEAAAKAPRAERQTAQASKKAPPNIDPACEQAARDQLSRASALRGERRYAEALEAYLRVVELNPRGPRAQAARVGAAAISLERFGDAGRAARLYSEAAARGGELGAEALFGLSEAHRALGDEGAERAALRAFLSTHPQSPLAAAARRRLEALSGP